LGTAAYGVFEIEGGSGAFASAGQLPPRVIDAHESWAADGPPTMPLGASAYGRYPEIEIALEPGETLALFTDGLVERRGIEVGTGIEKLIELMRNAPSAEDACLQAVEGMVPAEGPADDVAIVALQNTGVPAELHLRLKARPEVLAEVRNILRRWLRDLMWRWWTSRCRGRTVSVQRQNCDRACPVVER